MSTNTMDNVQILAVDGAYQIRRQDNLYYQIVKSGIVVIQGYSLESILHATNEVSPAYWMIKSLIAKRS